MKPPALDPRTVPAQTGSRYPSPLREKVGQRIKQRLGDALGLTRFGVNLVRLPPGALSSLRHWHTAQDEFVYIVEGEVTLVTDAGRQRLTPGSVAGFPAGRADGHHLINETKVDAVYLEVGDRPEHETVYYPDEDLLATVSPDGPVFTRRNGQSY
ncbi:MAG: cupin domain-containing protein [Alphaproteobacteria bacterium]|nr:cupin domain-containing protein [Alphaproteobacteria bacterium]